MVIDVAPRPAGTEPVADPAVGLSQPSGVGAGDRVPIPGLNLVLLAERELVHRCAHELHPVDLRAVRRTADTAVRGRTRVALEGNPRHGEPGYRCAAGRHIHRRAAAVDDYVTSVVLERLARADAHDLLDNNAPTWPRSAPKPPRYGPASRHANLFELEGWTKNLVIEHQPR